MTDENDRTPTLDEMLAEIPGRLKSLENSLPKQLDPIGLSRTKLPSKVLIYREALIWRVAELARAALQTFEAQQFAAAIVLTRAAVETNAALWFLDEKVGSALKQNKLGDLDDCVMRLLAGNYTWDEFPNPLRVGKFVESVERRVPGFKEQYNRLSEYAHPNSAGTTHLYSTIDRENVFVNFGPNSKYTEAAKAICVANLSVTLMMFEHIYNCLSDAMPDFVKLCEKEIPPL
ncbi:MAG TPA: hypothetical protein VFZ08_10120 [Terriglobia bacterium]|nr:hypothetical protein [Terriglobia bacterium]